jgi:hypothetical protein
MSVKSFDSPPAAVHCLDKTLDRRAFLGNIGLTAGAVIVTGIASLASGETPRPGCSIAAAPVSPGAALDSNELWHVDDMWGHWPRYAHPIPHACALTGTVWENVDPVDRMWVS